SCGNQLGQLDLFCGRCGASAERASAPALVVPHPMDEYPTGLLAGRILVLGLLLNAAGQTGEMLSLFAQESAGVLSWGLLWDVSLVFCWLWWFLSIRGALRRRGALTPGWGGFGSWFVPIINLIRPYQLVREVWRAAGAGSSGTIVVVWWCACL